MRIVALFHWASSLSQEEKGKSVVPAPLRSARLRLSAGANSSCLFHFILMDALISVDFSLSPIILQPTTLRIPELFLFIQI